MNHALCCDCDACLNRAPLRLAGAGRVVATGHESGATVRERERAAKRAGAARKRAGLKGAA